MCDGAEWLVTAVRVQNVVLPLLWYNLAVPAYTLFIGPLVPSSVDAVLCLTPLA